MEIKGECWTICKWVELILDYLIYVDVVRFVSQQNNIVIENVLAVFLTWIKIPLIVCQRPTQDQTSIYFQHTSFLRKGWEVFF